VSQPALTRAIQQLGDELGGFCCSAGCPREVKVSATPRIYGICMPGKWRALAAGTNQHSACATPVLDDRPGASKPSPTGISGESG